MYRDFEYYQKVYYSYLKLLLCYYYILIINLYYTIFIVLLFDCTTMVILISKNIAEESLIRFIFVSNILVLDLENACNLG